MDMNILKATNQIKSYKVLLKFQTTTAVLSMRLVSVLIIFLPKFLFNFNLNFPNISLIFFFNFTGVEFQMKICGVAKLWPKYTSTPSVEVDCTGKIT